MPDDKYIITPETKTKLDRLPHSFDAKDWGAAFVALVKEKPDIATDEATMITWFAGAIMCGYDRGAHNACRDLLDNCKLGRS
jgi:hypothetical protein